jgi:hypothetical protein
MVVKWFFQSNKFILFKGGILVENRYMCDGLFEINIMTIVTNNENTNKNVSSSYLLESCDVWRDRLGHMNYNLCKG